MYFYAYVLVIVHVNVYIIVDTRERMVSDESVRNFHEMVFRRKGIRKYICKRMYIYEHIVVHNCVCMLFFCVGEHMSDMLYYGSVDVCL